MLATFEPGGGGGATPAGGGGIPAVVGLRDLELELPLLDDFEPLLLLWDELPLFDDFELLLEDLEPVDLEVDGALAELFPFFDGFWTVSVGMGEVMTAWGLKNFFSLKMSSVILFRSKRVGGLADSGKSEAEMTVSYSGNRGSEGARTTERNDLSRVGILADRLGNWKAGNADGTLHFRQTLENIMQWEYDFIHQVRR